MKEYSGESFCESGGGGWERERGGHIKIYMHIN